jgi:hypothetical protein
MSQDTNVTLNGKAPRSDLITIKNGWNLMSVPTTDIKIDVSSYFNSEYFKIIWFYQDDQWKAYSNDQQMRMLMSMVYKIPILSDIDSSVGFWINNTKSESIEAWFTNDNIVQDSAPVVENFLISVNDKAVVSGSFDISHPYEVVKDMNLIYSINSDFSDATTLFIGSQLIEEQPTGSKSFSFDATDYQEKILYYKFESKSIHNNLVSTTVSGSIMIPKKPEETPNEPSFVDEAPVISHVDFSVDSDSMINGSFDISHPKDEVALLKVIFSSSSSFSSVDSMSFGTTTSTGTKTVQFDATKWVGREVFYKIELQSIDDGIKVDTNSSITIPTKEIDYTSDVTLDFNTTSGFGEEVVYSDGINSRNIKATLPAGEYNIYLESADSVFNANIQRIIKANDFASSDIESSDVSIAKMTINLSSPQTVTIPIIATSKSKIWVGIVDTNSTTEYKNGGNIEFGYTDNNMAQILSTDDMHLWFVNIDAQGTGQYKFSVESINDTNSLENFQVDFRNLGSAKSITQLNRAILSLEANTEYTISITIDGGPSPDFYGYYRIRLIKK